MTEVIIESALPPIEMNDTPETGGIDVEAPFGRKKDGTPARKRGRQPGASGASRSSGPLMSQDALAMTIVEMSMPVALFSPLAAAVIDDRADRTAKALLTLARQSPRFARALKGLNATTAYTELIFLPLGIATAIAVDYRKLPPDNYIAQKFGITEHYHRFVAANTEQVGEWAANQSETVESRSGLV